MNFEKMQTTWRTQFPAKTGTQPATVNAKLLERILRNQRGYARTLGVMALRDVMTFGLVVAALVFVAELGPDTSLRFIRECEIYAGVWVALLLILQGIILRRMPGMLAIRADRSPLMDRVHRDARRFRLGMIWGELKQVAMSALMVAFAVLLTARTGLQGPLRWVAVGLMGLPALAILARRVYLRSNRSAPAPDLSESIAGAIRETENQLQRMKRRRWYPPLYPVGIYLSLEPLWLRQGTIQPVGWVLLSIFVALWVLNLIVSSWMIRGLIRPRLRELEELRAGLMPVDPSDS